MAEPLNIPSNLSDRELIEAVEDKLKSLFPWRSPFIDLVTNIPTFNYSSSTPSEDDIIQLSGALGLRRDIEQVRNRGECDKYTLEIYQLITRYTIRIENTDTIRYNLPGHDASPWQQNGWVTATFEVREDRYPIASHFDSWDCSRVAECQKVCCWGFDYSGGSGPPVLSVHCSMLDDEGCYEKEGHLLRSVNSCEPNPCINIEEEQANNKSTPTPYHEIAKKKPVKVEGTGRTTSHVISIEVTNPTDHPVVYKQPPTLIGASQDAEGNTRQGYVILEGDPVIIEPGETVVIPGYGFCTDVDLKPVDDGAIIPNELITTFFDTEPYPHPGEQLTDDSPWTVADQNEESGPTLTYPGTDEEFPYRIDLNENPSAAAEYIFDVIEAIEESYDSLKNEGLISTPIHHNEDMERSTVIQQSFWIATGQLQGNEYSKEEYTNIMINELETNTGTNYEDQPPAIKENFDEGVDDFWDSFNLTAKNAEVIKEESVK